LPLTAVAACCSNLEDVEEGRTPQEADPDRHPAALVLVSTSRGLYYYL